MTTGTPGPKASDPVLHLIVGPNGAGKSTFFARVLHPITSLPFINADHIAQERWPDDAEAMSYEAARAASLARSALIDQQVSFASETVFSHPSKLELITQTRDAGYLITLHVVAIDPDLAVARVTNRVENGGHSVPAEKVRARFNRIWPLVIDAIDLVESTVIYDNSSAQNPFLTIAQFRSGNLVGNAKVPEWIPSIMRKRIQGT